MSKRLAPRRRETLTYPSPPSSIDSVSSCDSFSSSSDDSPTSPSFTSQFSYEPLSTQDEDYTTTPPSGALLIRRGGSRRKSETKKFTRSEEWKLWYSANFATNLLEPWEKILIHLLFISILYLSYIALSRLLSLATLVQLGGRAKFYATGTSI